MKIGDLKDKQGKVNMDLRIIWDQSKVQEMFGRKIKPVIVADVDTEEGPTAYLDVYDDDINELHAGDKIKVTDAYAKLIQNKSGQFRLTNAKKIECTGKVELK